MTETTLTLEEQIAAAAAISPIYAKFIEEAPKTTIE
jgi:hypothetical protein